MNLEDTFKDLIGGMAVNPAAPTETVERQAVYLDRSETTDTRWKALVSEHLKTAKTFEIHCWNEETEWIVLALKYGKLKESDWTYGKVITGEVTPEFVEMLLSQPKPTDIEAANKMTPFFNIFLDDTFQSSHWGTEIYYGG